MIKHGPADNAGRVALQAPRWSLMRRGFKLVRSQESQIPGTEPRPGLIFHRRDRYRCRERPQHNRGRSGKGKDATGGKVTRMGNGTLALTARTFTLLRRKKEAGDPPSRRAHWRNVSKNKRRPKVQDHRSATIGRHANGPQSRDNTWSGDWSGSENVNCACLGERHGLARTLRLPTPSDEKRRLFHVRHG